MRLAHDTSPTIPTSRTKRSKSGNFSETMFVTPDAPIDHCRCGPHSTSGPPDEASNQYLRLDALLRVDCPRACGLFCLQLPPKSVRDWCSQQVYCQASSFL